MGNKYVFRGDITVNHHYGPEPGPEGPPAPAYGANDYEDERAYGETLPGPQVTPPAEYEVAIVRLKEELVQTSALAAARSAELREVNAQLEGAGAHMAQMASNLQQLISFEGSRSARIATFREGLGTLAVSTVDEQNTQHNWVPLEAVQAFLESLVPTVAADLPDGPSAPADPAEGTPGEDG